MFSHCRLFLSCSSWGGWYGLGTTTLQPSESIVLFVKPYPYKSSVPAPGLCWIRFRSKGILVFRKTLLSSFQVCIISHLYRISVNLRKAAHPFTKNTFFLRCFFFFFSSSWPLSRSRVTFLSLSVCSGGTPLLSPKSYTVSYCHCDKSHGHCSLKQHKAWD